MVLATFNLLFSDTFNFGHSKILLLRRVKCGFYIRICHQRVNPLPDDKILDRSKLKQSADDNFKFYENIMKFSEWVENTVGKREIARYEQFLLFPQCFQKA